MRQEVTEQFTTTATQAIMAKAPYIGITATMVGGYSLNEWLAIVGIIFTTLTFFINWYMQHQRLKIMRVESEKRYVIKPNDYKA